MFSFTLENEFTNKYRNLKEPFGFNGLGSLVYHRTYSRVKPDGTNENWVDTCVRVINGMYTILKNHAIENKREWSDDKAQRSAQDAFDRLFNLKWTPPGRGLWVMGSSFIHERLTPEALMNCAFVSTKDLSSNPGEPFAWAMEMLMLGVGVGFDTDGAGKVKVIEKQSNIGYTPHNVTIEDSREGWSDSVRRLVNYYLFKGSVEPLFDYSLIRKRGEPIRGFGGVASGPEPLIELHEEIRSVFEKSRGNPLSSRNIADVMNMIGKCVVAGNVRRCLPGDAIVHTDKGAKPISEISVGDIVQTQFQKHTVTNIFKQGVQKTIKIQHSFGELECTPNHAVAVFDTTRAIRFVRADEVTTKDVLVWDSTGYDGEPHSLPRYEFTRQEHNTTGMPIVIPELDTEIAWLLGLIHGDGYIGRPSENAKNQSWSVSIACGDLYPSIVERAQNALSRFGVHPSVQQGNGKYKVIRVSSTELSKYLFTNLKQANETIVVPQWIANNTREIRAAYLAGLLDSDGAANNRPIVLCTTVYKEFADQLVQLYSSLGIATRANVNRKASGNWKEIHHVTTFGVENRRFVSETVGRYSCKEIKTVNRSANGFAFPVSMVRSEFNGKWIPNNEYITSDTVSKNTDVMFSLFPVRVLGTTSGREVETYDIEVDEIHSFTTSGLVVHNSAEIALGDIDDIEFMQLKNYSINPERQPYGWASNNTVKAKQGSDYSKVVDLIFDNGEPGIVWMDNAQKYGRMNGEPAVFDNVEGVNPCAEQFLESHELCTLVEVYPNRADNLYDYLRTLKYAYLYGKAVTLMSEYIADEKSREVMTRNRRIGTSNAGVAQFIAKHGTNEMRKWLSVGYDEIQRYDTVYSMWLDVPKSIRTTTSKPGGTVPLLAGATPGIHFPHSEYYLRRIRVSSDSELWQQYKDNGYHVEKDVVSPNTMIISFPIHAGENITPENEVSIWQQLAITAMTQKYWSDNGVSVTIKFNPEAITKQEMIDAIQLYEDQLKAVSFLPSKDEGAYPQMPYETISKQQYEAMIKRIETFSADIGKIDRMEDKYCDGEACAIF